MRRAINITLSAALTVAMLAFAAGAKEQQRQVEVVFVLDTTGSMGGLIEGAKMKIWSIANQIIKGEPQPQLKIGLVGYRDRGDSYITQVFDLSDDLDEVYANLTSFVAGGGGDGPEHVNRALSDAVERVDWSDDDATLRIVFLVGDAPPHLDYNDGYHYETACESAARRDIVVNTVQCGANAETTRFWREIARLGEGEYAAIAQDGGMQAMSTPMDEEIAELSRKLDGTVVAWGDETRMNQKLRAEEMAADMPAATVAERGVYKSESGRMGGYDLIDAIRDGDVELDKIERKLLPKELRAMSIEEMNAHLQSKKNERDEIRARISELTSRRDAFIKKKLAEGSAKGDSFDARVLGMLRAQASQKGLSY